MTVLVDDRTEAPTRTPTRALHRPPSPPVTTRPPRRRVLPWLVGALAAGLASGAAVATVGVPVSSARPGPTAAQVTAAIHALGTVSSAPQQVTTTFTVDNGLGLPGTSNAATYRAVGTASATVDLTQVAKSDVHLTSTGARISVPAAQMATPVVDQNRSRVVRRDDGFLTGVFNSEVSASDLQDQATSHLSDAAQQQGIAAQAQFIAAADVRAALRRVGITSTAVTVTSGS